MFIREKIDQMRASGSSIKDINDFRMAYDKGIAQGKTQPDALKFAEQHVTDKKIVVKSK